METTNLMKTLIFLFSSIVFASCVRFEISPSSSESGDRSPVMQMIYGEYDPFCFDSITDHNMMNVTVVNNVSDKIYVFSGSDSDCSFLIKMKDINAGRIENGDTLQCIYANYSICGQVHDLDTDAIPIVSENLGIVNIEYGDCIIPLDGTLGEIRIRLHQ